MKKICFSVFIIAFVLNSCTEHLIKDEHYKVQTQLMFQKQKELASGRSKQLFSVFDQNISGQEKEALEFLFAYMPLSDLADYDGNFFLAQAKFALKVKTEMPWGKIVPEDVFLHFVLPLRVNNENLDSFRIEMYSELTSRIKGLSMKEAALEINHWCHEKVTYKGADERTSSPLSTVRTSWGRCGEQSTFTVTAMRTVGIPARQVYTPRWAHSDDNHAWVEVWIDGKWYFLGACEPESDLSMGWFAEPARRAMLVHTRAYGWYGGVEPVIVSEARFSELNLIANYAPVKKFHVKVTDMSGKVVDSAKVEYQLYNYAEYYPIAKNYTNSSGLTSLTSGLGDLIIWANKNHSFGYKKISVNQTDTVKIQISTNHIYNSIDTFNLNPPIQPAPKEVSIKGKEKNAIRLKKEDDIRNLYMQTFKDSVWGIYFAKELGLDARNIIRYIKTSLGNWSEISKFLKNTPSTQRIWAMQMLENLTEKDLRDAKAVVLQDHLSNAFVNLPEKVALTDQTFYSKYIISPRISNELIRVWRKPLQTNFAQIFSSKKANATLISDWIRVNIKMDNVANLHSRSPLSPLGVFELRVSDTHSRDIFFVAVCRCLGIAARLNPATNLPQYFENQAWTNVYFDAQPEKIGKGFVHFVNGNSNIIPKYALHFTIARLENGNFKTLELDFWKKLDEFPSKIDLEAGTYMLVTGNRFEDGSVRSSISYFEVNENQCVDVKVSVLEKLNQNESYGKIEVKGYDFQQIGTKSKVSLANVAKKGCILIWMEPDKEPTKHVMADIPLVKDEFEKWGGGMVYLIPKEKMSGSFKLSNFAKQPKQSEFVLDVDNQLIKEIERTRCSAFKSSYPIIVVIDKTGNITYYSEGYKIGLGEQLAKAVSKLH